MLNRLWTATTAAVLGLAAFAPLGASAQERADSFATDWQLGLQKAATPVMEDLSFLHDVVLMPIITVITLFVLGLLIYVMWRFSEKNNPEPSRTTHNTTLEIIWTAVPVLILVVIAIPSFRLLYKADTLPTGANGVPAPEMTLKVIGRQWYWSYVYPDHGDIEFDSYMIPEADLKPGQLRLLEVDNRVVVPEDTTVRVLLTASDVLHNWAVPAFGQKTDTVTGRTNESWFYVDEPGVYRGQCSELCGVGHAYMPIVVEVVTKDEFEAWVGQKQAEMRGEAPKTDTADAPGGSEIPGSGAVEAAAASVPADIDG